MNLRDLEYICAVAEHQHFGNAAEACHVSQPTLSGQIKKLEAYLGVTLFERSNKSVRVTTVGQDIIDIAKEALNAVEHLQSVADAAKDPFAGNLTLGLIPTVAPYLIPLFVERLQSHLPKLSVTYSEDITERLTADLLAGTLHAAILATPPDSDRLAAIPLYSEPFWIIYPKGHDLCDAASVSMDDVTQDEILLLTEGHCFRDQALSICKPAATSTARSLRATSLETLINLVAAKQGITLVPSLAVNATITQSETLKAQKLDDPHAARTLYLTYRKRYPRVEVVEKIAKIIKSGLPEQVQEL